MYLLHRTDNTRIVLPKIPKDITQLVEGTSIHYFLGRWLGKRSIERMVKDLNQFFEYILTSSS
jgi:hypothetical protein